MAKELRGARAARELGRDVGALQEMFARKIITKTEFDDIRGRIAKELEQLNSEGRLNPHQYEKVLTDIKNGDAFSEEMFSVRGI